MLSENISENVTQQSNYKIILSNFYKIKIS